MDKYFSGLYRQDFEMLKHGFPGRYATIKCSQYRPGNGEQGRAKLYEEG